MQWRRRQLVLTAPAHGMLPRLRHRITLETQVINLERELEATRFRERLYGQAAAAQLARKDSAVADVSRVHVQGVNAAGRFLRCQSQPLTP